MVRRRGRPGQRGIFGRRKKMRSFFCCQDAEDDEVDDFLTQLIASEKHVNVGSSSPLALRNLLNET